MPERKSHAEMPPRDGVVCPRCGSGRWRLDRNWNGSQRCRCVPCRKAWMLAGWKKPRGRRHTPAIALAIVHGILAAGIMETTLLARAANITRWTAWNLRRKYLAQAAASACPSALPLPLLAR